MPNTTTEVPLTKITLYNNGFTSYERLSKSLNGNQELQLFFKNDSAEDVTKSIVFTAIEPSNGSVSNTAEIQSISYQNTKEATDDLTIDIPRDNSLTGLLSNLKGASVTLSFHGSSSFVTGILLGVEQQMDPTSRVHIDFITVYTNRCSIESFSLATMSNLQFNDPNIQSDIQHTLDTYISQRNKDLFKLSVFTQGSQEYKVKATYDTMGKAWKPNYRFQFTDESHEKGILDCLALIENNQEEDYDNVLVTLVTGSPFSSTGEPSEGSLTLSIRDADSGSTFSINVNPSTLVDDLKRKVAESRSINFNSVKLIFSGKQLEEGRMMSDYNIRGGSSLVLKVTGSNSASSGGDHGSFNNFRVADSKNLSFFPINHPVNVKRNQKAMISFLKKPLNVKPVLFFNESYKTGNPLNSILFQNTTGYVLEEGSIVFRDEKNNIAGETKLSQMWNNDEDLLPISLQLGIEVQKEFNTSETPYHYVFIKDGTLSFNKYKKQTASYNFDNKTEQAFNQLFLDHQFIEGWDFEHSKGFENTEPMDITDRYYRFEGSIKPKEKKKFSITEKAVKIENIDILGLTEDTLAKHESYISDEKVLSSLRETIKYGKEVNLILNNIRQVESDIRTNQDQQSRLRSNIEVLKSNPQQQSKYVTELSDKSDELIEMYSLKKSLEEKKSTLNTKQLSIAMGIVYKADIIAQ